MLLAPGAVARTDFDVRDLNSGSHPGFRYIKCHVAGTTEGVLGQLTLM